MSTPQPVTIAAAANVLFARTADRVIGMIETVPLPHGVGLVFPPDLDEAAAPSGQAVRKLLIEAAVQRLRGRGCGFAQLVLPSAECAAAAEFEACGFVRLTEAITFERPSLAESPSTAAPLEVHHCDPDRDAGLLTRMIERINQGSLDCPELDRWRTPDSLFAGHRFAAAGGVAEWRVYGRREAPWGAAFLSRRRESEDRELLFFGVVPEARGRRLGRAILSDLAVAPDPETKRIIAAADSRNHYAVSCYVLESFAEYARLKIWVHSLQGAR